MLLKSAVITLEVPDHCVHCVPHRVSSTKTSNTISSFFTVIIIKYNVQFLNGHRFTMSLPSMITFAKFDMIWYPYIYLCHNDGKLAVSWKTSYVSQVLIKVVSSVPGVRQNLRLKFWCTLMCKSQGHLRDKNHDLLWTLFLVLGMTIYGRFNLFKTVQFWKNPCLTPRNIGI